MSKVYISVGSNLGDRKRNIKKAFELLSNTSGIKIKRTSSIIETEPWGYKNQPKFLNTVWQIETKIPPEKLLKILKEIEKELGRKKTFKWGPRIIDLDILLYGRKKIDKKNLKIPHPQIKNRKFILSLLSEIKKIN
ncbi:MAG: 2-amino-4-hydroxy-6-hydroxymethyldihydropteridine diphosphokinase [Endomicrobiia bacterium]